MWRVSALSALALLTGLAGGAGAKMLYSPSWPLLLSVNQRWPPRSMIEVGPESSTGIAG